MISNKVVLVTGGTGLLGRQILRRLLTKYRTIYAVKRLNSVIPIQSSKICWIDIASVHDDIFSKIPEKIHYVVHAGAMVSYKESEKQKLFAINTDWTKKLAKDALQRKVEKFIFISSIAALGKNTKDGYIDENTPFSEKDISTNYGLSKREAEKALWRLKEAGLPIIIFNPSVVIGPANRYQSSAQLFSYVGDGKPFYTRGTINYIDARDVASLVASSLASKITNRQFVLSAGNIQYYDFFKAIAETLNVKAPWIGVPKFLVIMGAILENIVSKMKGQSPTLTKEKAKMARAEYIYSSKKAREAFDLTYTSLDQSIEWTIAEMQKTQQL